MDSDDRLETIKRLEDEVSSAKSQLDHAVKEILQVRSELETQKTRSNLFQQAASSMKLKFEATKLELEKMAQIKAGRPELLTKIDSLNGELEAAKERISELETSNKVLSENRDSSSKTFESMRDKIFRLECGLDERLVSLEGRALFFETRLTKVLKSMQQVLAGSFNWTCNYDGPSDV